MELEEAIRNRRSIRKYKSDPVNSKDLHKILQVASWAPSWANTQCWEFIIVKNQQTKLKLVKH